MERRRSLKKDKSDQNRLRHHRDRHLGFSVSNEYYQTVPFFYTRENMPLHLIGHYKGASAFMICNGPSLVKNNYDLSLLKMPGVITYGINNGPATVRPNLWSCVDDPRRFLKSIWLDPCIAKFVPHAHAEKKIFDNETWKDMDIVVGQCPNVQFFHRNEKFMGKRFLYEDTINWGNHKEYGGGRTVMLPVFKILFLLGFRKIYLLGADFNMSEDYTYHFDEQRTPGAVKGNMSTYQKLKDVYLPEIKKAFDAEGVEVYNLNPNSGLKVFPFKDYNEAIAEASSNLGFQNERTWGMYCKATDKQKMKNEPSIELKTHLNEIKNAPSTPVWGYKNLDKKKEPLNTQNIEIKLFENNLKEPSVVITPNNVTEVIKDTSNRIIKNKPCGI